MAKKIKRTEFEGVPNTVQGAILREIGDWQNQHAMRLSDAEFHHLRESMAAIFRLGVSEGINGEFS